MDTPICIHCFLKNHAVSLIIRISVDVLLWKPLCFLAYAFLMLSLFHVQFRFVFSARMSSHWFIKQLFNCFVDYLLELSYEFQSVSPLVDLLHLWNLLDHFHDLEVALLPPLVVILFQYGCLTLLSLHFSLLTGVMVLAPMCVRYHIPYFKIYMHSIYIFLRYYIYFLYFIKSILFKYVQLV